MNRDELATKLYGLGYSHDQVIKIWSYTWNEQNIGISGKKRESWQAEALEKLSLKPKDIEFYDNDDFSEKNNYF